ncbi:MAG: hypothetical protein MHPSP_004381, partial [Paramarteilia canceri]
MKEVLKPSNESNYLILEYKIEDIGIKIQLKLALFSLYPVLLGQLKESELIDSAFKNLNLDFNNYKEIKQKLCNGYNKLFYISSVDDLVLSYLKQAFEQVISRGDLCEEPMEGMAFILVESNAQICNHNNQKLYKFFTSSFKSCLDSTFSLNDFRIYWPIYKCFITCSMANMKNMRYVLEKRWGEIVSEHCGDVVVENMSDAQ